MASTFANQADTFQATLMSLFVGNPDDTEADLSKVFTPTFIQRDDDTTRDFAGFVQHMKWLRENLPAGSVNITITQFLRDGPHLAERHDSTLTKPDGTVSAAETLLFAEVAEDGRIAWIVEAVKPRK
ncbi:hypothetical protein BO94DRAFT_538998 [Aspergillus sclerotioniger CBS 115572]|uniref:SnoaL-like domain-containing protein n=1 Tax=Aspergillus sclerotioniger CBS 115572 TaxID=1450535 RepID=A0A317VFF2_9EURO|nr:hypothetical protein BO94DRAFT_538998 [Aspergillus sclerotioniger CBS 115572]PWY73116.1 hypothetical protein BO94DRAFT_538998 [Aspergillus sclerotioniger CBS 115572]